jgi:octaprenyl-diphosphate synthase
MGKGASTDIHKGRPVLPVILAYQQADPPTRRRIERCLSGQIGPDEALREMTAICASTHALELAAQKAEKHAKAALGALDVLEPSPARQHLAGYVAMTLNRDR